jgi:phage antirepressor YoqD-like protein
MQKEILNIEYHKACLAIKAVNSSISIGDAAKKLGIGTGQLYDIIRIANLKMKRGSCHIKPQKVTFKDVNDVVFQADPI